MRKLKLLPLLLAAALFLCSCVGEGADSLFVLPSPTDEHKDLQEQLNAVLAAGWEYTSPASGGIRTSYHFDNIDGEGGSEVFVLLRNTKTTELMLSVYKLDPDSDTYKPFASAALEGESFDRIELSDLDGDGSKEIIVGTRFGTDAMYGGSIYKLDGPNEMTCLLDFKYTDWAVYDMDLAGGNELVVLQNDETGKNAAAVLYGLSGGTAKTLGKAPLSSGVTKPDKIITGLVAEGLPAVVVEAKYKAGGYITDALAYIDKNLENLTFSAGDGYSAGYLRPGRVFSGDYNHDGYLELPVAATMRSIDDEARTRYDWMRVNGTGSVYIYSTYNDPDYGWYLMFPASWRHAVGIHVESGAGGGAGRRTTFYRASATEGIAASLAVVTAYVGQDRIKSGGDGEFVIVSKQDLLLTAEAGVGENLSSFAISSDELKNLIVVQ